MKAKTVYRTRYVSIPVTITIITQSIRHSVFKLRNDIFSPVLLKWMRECIYSDVPKTTLKMVMRRMNFSKPVIILSSLLYAGQVVNSENFKVLNFNNLILRFPIFTTEIPVSYPVFNNRTNLDVSMPGHYIHYFIGYIIPLYYIIKQVSSAKSI